jgi:hypothetical protein
MVSIVRSALYSTSDSQRRLAAAVRAYFDFIDDDTNIYRLIFESDLPTEPSVRWRMKQADAACVGAVRDVLIHGSGLDAHRAGAPAVGLVGAIQFTARYWLRADKPISKEQAVDTTLGLCWGGLSHLPLRTED